MRIFKNMTQNAKNMYNTTNFYIRQVYTGLTQDKEFNLYKKKFWIQLIKNIDKMNDVQLLAYQKNVKRQKSNQKKNKRS